MVKSQVAPYGSWKSPIRSDLIVSEEIGLGQIVVDGHEIYWIESRPAEGGRYVIVRRTPDGKYTDMTPMPFNARTRVHEYGGGAYTVDNGTIYFSNFEDQRIYRQERNASPQPLTRMCDMRYADAVIDSHRRKIICVREDHTPTDFEPINTLVSIDLEDAHNGKVLVAGADFYSSPRLSPDGSRLAWVCWNHPNMPWDGTELWTAEFRTNGSLEKAHCVAADIGVSILQPEWSPDGTLHFVSDHAGWWNLYCWRNGSIQSLCEMHAEFAMPHWAFGLCTYGFESPTHIICGYNQRGTWRLGRLDTEARHLQQIKIPYTDISRAGVRVMTGSVVFGGGSPTTADSIVQLDLVTDELDVLRCSSAIETDASYLSIPQAIEFPTEDALTAHGFFYPPQNREYTAPSDERPPLLVKSHGGPTGATSASLDLTIQYWTSRGIAVLDVNYGGSTGYGRTYRTRLDGKWGLVDVDDCVNGVRYLIQHGKVDGDRVTIDGRSAGGYTTLCALAFRDIFKAGASYFGISDLEAMSDDTHKFESRYLERLIGAYPECRDIYRRRSPIHFTDQLSCPVILFQGLEDKIVPPNQAEMMVRALRKKGLPVAYVPFEGEQHGFRRAENIKRCLDAELYFYSRIFGFNLAEPVAPVVIENFDG